MARNAKSLIRIEQLSDFAKKKLKLEMQCRLGSTGSGPFWRCVLSKEHARIPVHAKAHQAPKIDVPEVHRPDASQHIFLDTLPTGLQPIHGFLKLHGVPADHHIGQQCVSTRDGPKFVPAPTALGSYSPIVDGAL